MRTDGAWMDFAKPSTRSPLLFRTTPVIEPDFVELHQALSTLMMQHPVVEEEVHGCRILKNQHEIWPMCLED